LECRRKARREFVKANPEIAKEQRARWNENCKEWRKEYDRNRLLTHRDSIIAAKRKWEEDNKEYRAEKHKQWIKENPNKVKQYNKNRAKVGKVERELLSDKYIKHTLNHGAEVRLTEFPQGMIEAKRKLIKLRRMIYENRNDIAKRTSRSI
jgi:hypothetical protein